MGFFLDNIYIVLPLVIEVKIVFLKNDPSFKISLG